MRGRGSAAWRIRFATLLLTLAAAPAVAAQDVGRQVDEIVEAWRAGRWEGEAEVRRLLVQCGPAAVPPVCRLLQDTTARLPAEAMAAALGDLGDPQAVATLARLRTWTATPVALAAVEALLTLADPACVEPLLEALDDPRDELQMVVGDGLLAWSLTTPEVPLVRPALDRVSQARHPFTFTLLLAQVGGPEVHEGLHRLLVAARDEVQMAVLDGLTLMAVPGDGAPVTEVLRRSRTPGVQRKCALLLGRLRHGGATRDLIDLLHESDAGLVQDAHWALRQITGLRLKADPDLWEQWWERGGKEGAGS